MTALLTKTVAATVVVDLDVELSKAGYPVGLATFFQNGNHVGPRGISVDTLDVIDCLLEAGERFGTTDGYDWSVL